MDIGCVYLLPYTHHWKGDNPSMGLYDETRKIPVILDTDLGGDIDDTWAIAMMLKSPELDVKLIVTDHGNTIERTKILAKLLERAGRTDIPIGTGIMQDDDLLSQSAWVTDYDLANYSGTIHEDGVTALIDTIMKSNEQITLICIGPMPNIGEALRREPHIAEKARFVGMHGSIRRRHDGQDGAIAEYNVIKDVAGAQAVFTAGWDKTITPLDTCGIVRLDGERYQAVCASTDPLTQAVIENYHIWLHGREEAGCSSILFDTVAIYLAFTEELLQMERLGIRVTDDGFTRVETDAPVVNCATEWKDLEAFKDLLVARLTVRDAQPVR